MAPKITRNTLAITTACVEKLAAAFSAERQAFKHRFYVDSVHSYGEFRMYAALLWSAS
jgi:hypothetical protein